jgi:hypothetical protein
MEEFNEQKAIYFRVFWMPIGIVLFCRVILTIWLGPGPWWGEGLLGLFGCFTFVLSVAFLIWGGVLIFVGMRSRAHVAALILATFVSGLPTLVFLILSILSLLGINI